MQYHASMNWAAPQFGWAFIVQGGLLALVALVGKRLSWHKPFEGVSWPGLVLLLLALFYPLLGWFEGRTFLQWEWLGLMPAPLTVATLGVLLLCVGWLRWLLILIPLLWTLVSAAFTLKLELLEPYVAAVILFVLIVSLFSSRLKDQASNN